MKNTAYALLAGFALAASAQAGDDYSSKGGKEIIAPPAPQCLWTWFAGGSYGHVSGDWDEDIWTLHVGAERRCPGSNCTHSLYLEVGFTDKDETVRYQDPTVTAVIFVDHDVDVDIMPITLNYKYECALTDKFNWYVGAGAGVAITDIDISGPVVDGSDSDTSFYAHIFAGLTYNVSESFEIFGGARYIFMDEAFDISGFDFLDGGVQYELGARFNF